MPLIDWIPSYNIGIPEIDTDNQQLVGMINLLHDSISKKDNHEIVNHVIYQLVQNYQDHCTLTLQVLQNIQYTNLTQQQESHKKFGRVISGYLHRLKKDEKVSIMELIGFLRNWFDKHVLLEDQKIKAFLKQINNTQTETDITKSHVKTIKDSDIFQLHNNKMDGQHKDLANIYNKLYHAVELKMSKKIILKIIDTFKHYAEIHFKDEEQLMIDVGYDQYKEHLILHNKLLKEFDKFLIKINEDETISHIKILGYIRNWLLNHIAIEDKKVFAFISSQKKENSHA